MGQGMTTLVLVVIDALKDYKQRKARGATVAALKHAADAPTATEQEQLLQRERFGGQTGRPFDPVVVAREVNKARFRRRMDALHHVRAAMQAQRSFVLSPVPEVTSAGASHASDADVDADDGSVSDTDDVGAGGGEDAPLIRRTGGKRSSNKRSSKHGRSCRCRRHRRSKSDPSKSGDTGKGNASKTRGTSTSSCCSGKRSCTCRRQHADVPGGIAMVCL